MKHPDPIHAAVARTKPPVIAPGHAPASVTEKITSVVLEKLPRWWYLAFGV